MSLDDSLFGSVFGRQPSVSEATIKVRLAELAQKIAGIGVAMNQNFEKVRQVFKLIDDRFQKIEAAIAELKAKGNANDDHPQ